MCAQSVKIRPTAYWTRGLLRHGCLYMCLLFGVGCLLAGPVDAQLLQRRPRILKALRVQAQRNARAAKRAQAFKPLAVKQDAAAILLLRRRLRPGADYAGQQTTELVGGRVSHQNVQGDTRGRVRIDYVSPKSMSGDILLIGPDQFRNYHARTRQLDVAFWPTPWNEREKRVLEEIRKKQVLVERVGEERIAGRDAIIVAVSTRGVVGAPPRGQLRYWIDSQTGIELKNEIMGPNGIVSRSYMTQIIVGPATGVTTATFSPPILKDAQARPLFPADQPHYRNMTEALPHLPFLPLSPHILPTGYHLSGIWVFTANKPEQASILQQYTDGVTSFSLFQRQVRPNTLQPIKPLRRVSRQHIQRWRVARGDQELILTYIGVLAPSEVQTLYQSLLP